MTLAQPSLAKHPVGLVFLDDRPATLSWEQLERGHRLVVCNGNRAATRVRVVVAGFGFTLAGRPKGDAAVLSLKGLPPSGVLAGGACRKLRIVRNADARLDPGRYLGRVAVVGKGAGIARARVTIHRSRSLLAATLVQTHVSLGKTDYDAVSLDETMQLRVPRDTPNLRRLIFARKRSAGEESAFAELARQLGLPFAYYNRHEQPLALRLGKRMAVLTLYRPHTLVSLDAIAENDGGPTGGGSLRVTSENDRLRMRIEGPEPGANVRWNVSVELDERLQRSVSPMPTMQRGDLLRWSFSASQPHVTTVRFALDDDDRRTLLLGNEVPQALRAVAYFAAEALFLLILLLICRRAAQPEAGPLRRVTWAGLALLLAMLALWMLQIFGEHVTWRSAGDSQWSEFAYLLVGIGAPLAAAGLLLSVGFEPTRLRHRRAWLWIGAVFAVAAVAMFALANRTIDDPYPGLLEFDAARWALAATGPLLVFVIVATILAAAAMIVRWSWSDAKEPHDEGTDDEETAKTRWWISAGLIALALFTALQWSRAVKTRAEDRPSVEVNGKALTAWWDDLATNVAYMPLDLLSRLVPLLPLLVTAAALPLLRRLGGVSAMSLRKRERSCLILIALFAGVVVGSGGVLEGFRVPLALVLAFAFLFLLLRDPTDQQDSAPLSLNARRELTTRAMEYEAYRRDQSELYGKLTAGEIDLDAYRSKMRQLVAPLSDVDPLSRGPFDDWWRNATAAARLGAYLSLAPLAYYVGVIVAHRIDDDLSSTSEFGLLEVLVGLTGEAATWIVAAFVFGGLYAHLPKRQGPVKGALLALVFAASLGLSAEILPDANSAWTFRALEMLLFLGALGFVIDRQTVERQGFYWREVFDIYRLRELRFAAGYLTSLSIALLAIFQQILTGEGQEAITALVEAAGVAVPDTGS